MQDAATSLGSFFQLQFLWVPQSNMWTLNASQSRLEQRSG